VLLPCIIYAANVWDKGLLTIKVIKRIGVCVPGVYRTVSKVALQAFAGMFFLDLVAEVKNVVNRQNIKAGLTDVETEKAKI